jgi:hypothetical protein
MFKLVASAAVTVVVGVKVLSFIIRAEAISFRRLLRFRRTTSACGGPLRPMQPYF